MKTDQVRFHPRSSVIKKVLVVVAAVAVDLAANFTTGPGRAVDVYISRASANGGDKFIHFSGIQSLCSGGCGRRNIWTHVCSDDRARDRCGRRGTWLSSGRTIAEISAKKHGNAAG